MESTMQVDHATSRRWRRTVLAVLGAAALGLGQTAGQEEPTPKLAAPITVGQRMFSCGHSFHVWVPAIVADLCQKAGIPNHVQLGVSGIGGSRTIQHWD